MREFLLMNSSIFCYSIKVNKFSGGLILDFYMKLPRNKKEFVLFLLIISILSVNIIAPLITFLEVGFSKESYLNTLKVIPIIWIFVVILVLLTHNPAEKITQKIIHKDDSYRSVLTVNILVNVFLMSIFMTIIGTWIGSRSVNFDVFHNYLNVWPRNFTLAFGVELLIAQPIARFVLYKIHVSKDKKS